MIITGYGSDRYSMGADEGWWDDETPDQESWWDKLLQSGDPGIYQAKKAYQAARAAGISMHQLIDPGTAKAAQAADAAATVAIEQIKQKAIKWRQEVEGKAASGAKAEVSTIAMIGVGGYLLYRLLRF